MVGNSSSKILTVSYGTFSCTLEGFEDSFGTMKAIAEYFRDLAADDRYFGAEPPSPDAEMLARIAEKEIARRVEARSENGSYVLRPYRIEQTQAEAAPAPVAKPATVTAPPPAMTEEEDEDNSEPFFTPPTARAKVSESSIAEKLQRIRAAALHEDIEEDVPSIEDAIEAAPEPAVMEEDDDQEDVLVAEELAEEDLEDDISEETPAVFAETEVADLDDDEEIFAVALDEAKDDPIADDEAAEDDELNALLDAVSDEPAEDLAEDEAEEALEAEEDDFELELDDLLADDVEEDTSEDVDEDYMSDDEGLLEDDQDDFDEDEDEDEDDLIAATLADDDEDEDEDDAPAPTVRARVMHVKGASAEDLADLDFGHTAYDDDEPTVDAESLDAIFDDEDEDEDDDQDVAATDDASTSLSPEDEEDLLRELAEVEASDEADLEDEWEDELLDEDDEVEVTDEENLFANDPEEALANAQDLSSLLSGASADNEVSRLIAEAEEQMARPDANRRRNTIAHLKAAVLAKRADGTATRKEDDTEGSATYRDDLADAVKPRRPVRPVLPSAEPRRPVAPLRLVAEQKVVPVRTELPAEPISTHATAVKPVRPRRIASGGRVQQSAAVAQETLDEDSFEAFAAYHGVDRLPELLEAAASYATFVEGMEKFSRPQVMTHVRDVMGDDYSREDGLRAFGQLLREGKLIKLEGGRFTVSDGIGYQP